MQALFGYCVLTLTVGRVPLVVLEVCAAFTLYRTSLQYVSHPRAARLAPMICHLGNPLNLHAGPIELTARERLSP
jgi:hypothetical protein